MSKAQKLNPQVRSVEIGIREMREIKIYPLSFRDQQSLVENLIGGLNTFSEKAEGEDLKDADVPMIIIEMIKEKIEVVLELVTDPEEEIDVDGLTNMQISEIVNIIYKENFKEPSKKVEDLLKIVKPLVLQQGQQLLGRS